MGDQRAGGGIRMAQAERVSYEVAAKRLHQFEHLSQVLSDGWLKTQVQKPVERYSLIAGWLTTPEAEWNPLWQFRIAALDNAVAILAGNVSQTVWDKLQKKITAHSDRAESKGTLAEISLALFLVQHNIPFEMETQLDSASKKDVDFSLQFDGQEPVHIEMQWVSESDALARAADALAPYKLPATINFPQEEIRILNKVYDKTSKFTQDDITLVALDCTTFPEIGGTYPWVPIGAALGHTMGNQIYGPLSEKAIVIRELVDGVIWFESDPRNAFFPVKRGYLLNQHSPHSHKLSLSRWGELWSNTNGEGA